MDIERLNIKDIEDNETSSKNAWSYFSAIENNSSKSTHTKNDTVLVDEKGAADLNKMLYIYDNESKRKSLNS